MRRYPKKLGVLLTRNEVARQVEDILSEIEVNLNVWPPMRDLSTAIASYLSQCFMAFSFAEL